MRQPEFVFDVVNDIGILAGCIRRDNFQDFESQKR